MSCLSVWRMSGRGGGGCSGRIWGPRGFLQSGIRVLGVQDVGSRVWGFWKSRSRVWGVWESCKMQFLSRNFQIQTAWRGKYDPKTAFLKITQDCGYSKHSSYEKTYFCLEIFQIQLLGEEIWGRNCVFQENIGVQVLKTFTLKKMTPFHLGIFQIQPFGQEIWEQNCIFQDNIGCVGTQNVHLKWIPFDLGFYWKIFSFCFCFPQPPC